VPATPHSTTLSTHPSFTISPPFFMAGPSAKRPPDSPPVDTPSPKTPRTDHVLLSLTDDQHKAMDEEVLAAYAASVDEGVTALDLSDLIGLLITIVMKSADLLDPRYIHHMSTKNLLRGDPDLATQLQNAWDKQSFSSIRTLRKSSDPASFSLPHC
jgi:hypothetical protein